MITYLRRRPWQVASWVIPLLMIAVSIRSHTIVAGWDMDLSGFNPSLAIHRASSTWASNANMGYDGGLGTSLLWPIYSALYLFRLAGVPYDVTQWLLYAVILVVSSQAMYQLARRVLQANDPRLCSLVAIVYITNFYALITWYTPLLFVVLAYAMAPLLSVAVYDAIAKRTSRSLVALLVVALVSSGAGANLAYWLMMTTVALAAGILAVSRSPHRGSASWYLTCIACVFLALNAWWLAPAAHASLAHLHELNATTYSLAHNDGALVATSEASTLSRSLRMIGTWDFFHYDRAGAYYLTFAKFFQPGTAAGLLTFVLPWLLVRLFNYRRPGVLTYVSLWFLCAVFLMKGVAAPFEGLFWVFYQHFPGAAMFRTPYTKFGLMAAPAFAILIGFVLERIIKARSREIYVVGVLAAVVGATICSQTLFRRNDHQPSYYVQFPAAYFDAARYASEAGTQRILSLPQGQQISFVAFQWGYNGTDPYYRLLTRDAILERNNWANTYADGALKVLDKLPTASVSKVKRILDYLDVDTVIVHRDIVWNFYNTAPATEIEKKLSKFCSVRSFKDDKRGVYIDVFVRRDAPPGRILVTKRLLRRTPDNIDLLLSLRQRTVPEISRDAIMTQFIKNEDIVSPGPVPTIATERRGPGDYMIRVAPSHFQFYLALRDAYDPGWRATYLLNGKWHDAGPPFVANGYQDAWYLPSGEASQIHVFYSPQRYFTYGAIASLLTLLLSLSVIGIGARHGIFSKMQLQPERSEIDIVPVEAERLTAFMGLAAVCVAAALDFFNLQTDADMAIAVTLMCFFVLTIRPVPAFTQIIANLGGRAHKI